MSTWIAAVVAVAAIIATYLSCVRSAMRGRCTTGGPPRAMLRPSGSSPS
ncbi:MAG: hypothetical protein ACRDSG_13755 [Pseudonocardiaceae bacterium]